MAAASPHLSDRGPPVMINLAAYAGLFMAAFLAATLIPAQSESVLTGLLLAGGQTPLRWWRWRASAMCWDRCSTG
jgi:membrane protein YqaA with SNARE-associated domain